MTRALLFALFGFAVFSTGCDQSRSVLPPPPPHGGTAFALPQGNGFVEVLKQDAPEQPGQTRLVIYFMDTERKPLRSAPAGVSFHPRGKKAPRISLTPTSDSEPSTASGLASALFADPGELIGSLSAKIDGEPLSIAISVR
jgi:hypothetical protein